MLDKDTTWIVCPRNDLEAVTIIALANEYGFNVVNGPDYWGAVFEDALDVNTIPSHINCLVVCELPFKSPQTLAQLKRKNIAVIELDHHVYANQDKSHPLSCLEQFAGLIQHSLTRQQQLIAANDRGFIPALAQAGASYHEMLEIREQEAAVRNVSDLRNQAKNWLLSTHPTIVGDYLVYSCPTDYSKVLAELVQMPTPDAYQAAMTARTKLLLAQIVLLYKNQQGITQIEVLGRDKRDYFNHFAKAWHNESTATWFGGEAPSFFFGIKAAAGKVLPNTLLEQIEEKLTGVAK